MGGSGRGARGLRALVILVLAGVLGAFGVARAEDDPGLARATAIYGILGVGTPVGWLGLEASHRFTPRFELSGGLGIGASAARSGADDSLAHDLQWSLMPRARVGGERNAATVGVGGSFGQYGGVQIIQGEEEAGRPYPTHNTLWLNVEIGGEHQTRTGLVFRYFIGGSVGETVGSPAGTVWHDYAIPYTGIGLGYAL